MLKENNRRLTSVFFIGSQKCGTSTLFEWLKQDKRLLFPTNKETHYFSTNFDFGLKWYDRQFKLNEAFRLRCEIDPSYIFYPESIERIYRYNNQSKLIILLRHPIQRAYSQYLMSKFRTYETSAFNDSIINNLNFINKNDDSHIFLNLNYLKRSQYSSQINVINNFFDKKECLYIKFEDFFTNKNSLNIIYDFLDMDFDNSINLNIRANYAKEYKNIIFQKLLYRNSYLKTSIRKFISREKLYSIKKYLSFLNQKNINENKKIINYNKIVKNLPQKIVNWNNKEVEKLEKIIDLNISNWYL